MGFLRKTIDKKHKMLYNNIVRGTEDFFGAIYGYRKTDIVTKLFQKVLKNS